MHKKNPSLFFSLKLPLFSFFTLWCRARDGVLSTRYSVLHIAVEYSAYGNLCEVRAKSRYFALSGFRHAAQTTSHEDVYLVREASAHGEISCLNLILPCVSYIHLENETLSDNLHIFTMGSKHTFPGF